MESEVREQIRFTPWEDAIPSTGFRSFSTLLLSTALIGACAPKKVEQTEVESTVTNGTPLKWDLKGRRWSVAGNSGSPEVEFLIARGFNRGEEFFSGVVQSRSCQ